MSRRLWSLCDVGEAKMADFEYDNSAGAGHSARGIEMAAVVNWLGALTSVALIAGLAFWGYQLMVRDVSGVPVVRALEGPMRVAPENPGGQSMEYQGLAVNRIAAKGEAEAPADRLVLAPTPVILTEVDRTRRELDAASAAPIVDDPSDALATDIAVAEALAGLSVADTSANAAEAQMMTAALDSAQDVAAVANTASIGRNGELIPTSVAGVSRSVRPVPRPVSLATSPVAAQVFTGVKTVDPDTIPVGTRLAQLGAYETPEIARAEWQKLTVKFQDVLGDKTQVIQQAQSGGKAFYRLRAMGFDDISDARRFCSALLAGQAACIPVITR